MTQQRILIWYRNDLRIHDHEPLYQALQEKAQVIPLYCFDPRQFGQTSYGFPKTGSFRTQFIIESVANLKSSLQQLGSDLIIRHGEPEKIIPELAQLLDINTVYYHQEITSEELAVEKAIAKNISMKGFWGTTLYHPDDLPFEISELPELFTNFRKKVEKHGTIRQTFPFPKQLPPLPEIDVGKMPTFEELGVEPSVFDPKATVKRQGGETAGINRLNDYFFLKDQLKVYKETRNGMLEVDDSSKFSAWLSAGCLSPRYIYEQVQKYESERIKNDSTYWLIFELLWRDYFRFICAKHGDKVFYRSGIQGIDIPWQEDWTRFQLWQEGKTGYPLVDANMRELLASGFMSNRGRQNVASFLTKNLGINWQIGTEWFESMLVDYDVCSNWGNWNYTAGIGNDARGFRYFNIPKQSKEYDPNGDYLRYWLPELASIPGDKIHEPWKLSQEEQKRYGVILGVDYPRPVVDFFKSIQNNEAIYNAALGRK